MTDQPLFIVVSGNIASGKTTFCKAFSTLMKLPVVYEPVTENPFLPMFYRDMGKYSLVTQVCFLYNRFINYSKLVLIKGMISDRSVFDDAVFAQVVSQTPYTPIWLKRMMEKEMLVYLASFIFGLSAIMCTACFTMLFSIVMLMLALAVLLGWKWMLSYYARTMCMSNLDLEAYRQLRRMLLAKAKRPDVVIYLDAPPWTCLERLTERKRPMEKSVDILYLRTIDDCYRDWLREMSVDSLVYVIPYTKYYTEEKLYILRNLISKQRNETKPPGIIYLTENWAVNYSKDYNSQ